jgi:hypothetical protein
MDSDSFDIYSKGGVSASFGTTTTIGPVSLEHISMTSGSFSLKRGDITYLSASSAGLEMSGSILASKGKVGGWTIGTNTLTGGDVELDAANELLTIG